MYSVKVSTQSIAQFRCRHLFSIEIQTCFDQVVVHSIDDDRDWMGRCSCELEVEVQLALAQQNNMCIFRYSVWGQVESKQLVCQTHPAVDTIGL